jgi:hypothetical protein
MHVTWPRSLILVKMDNLDRCTKNPELSRADTINGWEDYCTTIVAQWIGCFASPRRCFQPTMTPTASSSMPNVPPDQNTYNADIRPHERFWVDQQPFLLSRGYKLRPRYDPAWVPSWQRPGNEGEFPIFFEDGSGLLVSTFSRFCTSLLMALHYYAES